MYKTDRRRVHVDVTTYVSSLIFLSATVLPVSLTRPLYTTPYVPSPIFSSFSKQSIRSSNTAMVVRLEERRGRERERERKRERERITIILCRPFLKQTAEKSLLKGRHSPYQSIIKMPQLTQVLAINCTRNGAGLR